MKPFEPVGKRTIQLVYLHIHILVIRPIFSPDYHPLAHTPTSSSFMIKISHVGRDRVETIINLLLKIQLQVKAIIVFSKHLLSGRIRVRTSISLDVVHFNEPSQAPSIQDIRIVIHS